VLPFCGLFFFTTLIRTLFCSLSLEAHCLSEVGEQSGLGEHFLPSRKQISKNRLFPSPGCATSHDDVVLVLRSSSLTAFINAKEIRSCVSTIQMLTARRKILLVSLLHIVRDDHRTITISSFALHVVYK
jgi:hypothetical protein